MTPEMQAKMSEAFEKFRQSHTIDNRTPREMFYNGFYAGYDAGLVDALSDLKDVARENRIPI